MRYWRRAASQVGYAAQDAQARDPQNTIVSVKRLMGRGLTDLADARRFPYRLRRCAGHGADRDARTGVQSPVEVSAEILTALRLRAEAQPRRRIWSAR